MDGPLQNVFLIRIACKKLKVIYYFVIEVNKNDCSLRSKNVSIERKLVSAILWGSKNSLWMVHRRVGVNKLRIKSNNRIGGQKVM